MEEKEKKERLEQRARDLIEKARSLVGKISFLTEPLPRIYRGRIRDGMLARHGSENEFKNIEFSHHLSPEDILWKLEFHFEVFLDLQRIELCQVDTFHDQIIKSWFIGAGNSADHCSSLIEELAQKEDLLDFIHNSLRETKNIFNAVYEEVEKEIDIDTMGLVRDLRERNQKITELKKENTLLKKDIRASSAAMDRSIERLEKSTEALENTKAFLGKSKTIKEIRENIEKALSDLKEALKIDRF